MNDANDNDMELRLVGADPPARVVLAEVDAPGPLHYLLEAEGFRVLGCASDEHELARVLQQGVRPDVVVIDADVPATSVVTTRQLAASAHVVVIWPDDVQAPLGAERVSLARAYEDLGPAIRRYMDKHRVPEPIITLPADERPSVPAASAGPGAAVGRAASRVSLTTVGLIAAIVLTMGASFALGSYRARLTAEPSRVAAPKPSVDPDSVVSEPSTGRDAMRVVPASGSDRCARAGEEHRSAAADASSCGDRGASPHRDRAVGHVGDTPSQAAPVESTGGQGEGGSTPDDQGGGNPGGHHGQDPGDHGGNQDGEGEDEQGDQGDQGGNQDDQGGDDQGDDQGSQGRDGSHGDTHGTQSDDQG